MAAVSQPQLRPITSWMTSMRGLALCFVDDVLEEDGALLGGGQRAERLADRNDVVVDRLRQADDGQVVAVVAEIGGKVGRRGVGVVAADGVEDGDAVLGELLGRDLRAGFSPSLTRPRFTQSATLVSLTRLLPIGEPPCAVQDMRAGRALSAVTAIESPSSRPVIAAEIADELDLGRDVGVALDQRGHRRGKAGRKPTGGQHCDFVLRHFSAPARVISRARGDTRPAMRDQTTGRDGHSANLLPRPGEGVAKGDG